MKQDKLIRAINGLLAYYVGCTDSGISDPALSAKVKSELDAMTDTQKQELKDAYFKKFHTPEHLATYRYSDEDVQAEREELDDWLSFISP